jgi:hypothetical protein
MGRPFRTARVRGKAGRSYRQVYLGETLAEKPEAVKAVPVRAGRTDGVPRRHA